MIWPPWPHRAPLLRYSSSRNDGAVAHRRFEHVLARTGLHPRLTASSIPSRSITLRRGEVHGRDLQALALDVLIDVDSTVCEVVGKAKQGAAFGYTKVLGYHPILATRADTGEVCHARKRKGSANTSRGARRFIDELVPRLRRAGASGEIVGSEAKC